MIRDRVRGALAILSLAVFALAGCSVIAPLEDVKDNSANGGARSAGGGAPTSGRAGANGTGGAANCSGVFDEALFDEACFQ